MKTLTVFTPAFNREHMLKGLYESLLAQESKDFIWLVVDDGSEDGTWDLLKSFEDQGRISMRLIRQENGGKMRAHNRGVLSADTELFVCLDSDDSFTKNAVSDILERWEKVRNNKHIAGIVANKGQAENKPLYGQYLPEVTEDTLSGLYLKGFKGETTLVYRTEILKQHLFPEIPGEKYVPEDVVYDMIDREYSLSVMNRVLTLCVLTDEGLTERAKELREKNPGGWYIYYVNRSKYTPPSLLKLKYLSHYLRFRPVVDKNLREKYSLPFLCALPGLPGAALLMLVGKR